MPTLYTSLIARQNPKLRTLAPKQQRTAVTPERAAKSVEALQATVADEHLGQLAEIVRVQASNKWIAVIGAGFAGLSAAYELRKTRLSSDHFRSLGPSGVHGKRSAVRLSAGAQARCPRPGALDANHIPTSKSQEAVSVLPLTSASRHF